MMRISYEKEKKIKQMRKVENSILGVLDFHALY